jgi:hypothetical protein
LPVFTQGRIIWAGIAANLYVTNDRYLTGSHQLHIVLLTTCGVVQCTIERPIAPVKALEVSIVNSGLALIGMATKAPSPKRAPYFAIHVRERLFAVYAFVVVSPASKNRVKMSDDIFNLCRFVAFQPITDSLKERMHFFLLWFNDALAVIRPHIEAQEVEPVFDVNNSGFLCVEYKTAFCQELLDYGSKCLNLLLGPCGDNKVISVANVTRLAN